VVEHDQAARVAEDRATTATRRADRIEGELATIRARLDDLQNELTQMPMSGRASSL
jgi:hypothetical protein